MGTAKKAVATSDAEDDSPDGPYYASFIFITARQCFVIGSESRNISESARLFLASPHARVNNLDQVKRFVNSGILLS